MKRSEMLIIISDLIYDSRTINGGYLSAPDTASIILAAIEAYGMIPPESSTYHSLSTPREWERE